MKKILTVYPFLLSLLFLRSFFVSIDPNPKFESIQFENRMSSSNSILPFKLNDGILQKIFTVSDTIKALSIENFPTDGKPESTIEELEKINISQKVLLFVLLFGTILSLSAGISFYFKTFFSKTLYFTLLAITTPMLFMLLSFSLESIKIFPILGTFLSILFAIFFFANIVFLVKVAKLDKKELENYLSLQLSKGVEDEGSSRKTSTGDSFYAKVLLHFAIIILVGLLVGNLIYIPIFLLQKYFAFHFSILLVVLLILLFSFYIKNYSTIGGDPTKTRLQNILVGFSFLQYRVLRNTFSFFSYSLAIVIFVTLLVFILFANIDFLRSFSGDWIPKSTEL